MRIDKKLLAPIAMLSVILFAGTAYAIVTFRTTTNVTVTEPLTVTPPTTEVSVFAGGTFDYSVNVANAAPFAIPINFATSVAPPTGGSANDVSCTTTLANGTPVPGTGSISITVSCVVGAAAVPGLYTITNTVDKARPSALPNLVLLDSAGLPCSPTVVDSCFFTFNPAQPFLANGLCGTGGSMTTLPPVVGPTCTTYHLDNLGGPIPKGTTFIVTMTAGTTTLTIATLSDSTTLPTTIGFDLRLLQNNIFWTITIDPSGSIQEQSTVTQRTYQFILIT